MKTTGAIWKVGLRLAIAGLLLLWIFHAIFSLEGSRWWESIHKDGSWGRLDRVDQWRAAWSHGPRELWQTISLVQPSALALSLLWMGLTIVAGVFRWRMVLKVQGLNLSLGRTLEIALVAHFFNSFLLGSTGGDLLKAYYAARETHHKKTEAVLTVFIDRLLGLFAMLLFACVMMIPNLSLLTAHRPLAIVCGFIIIMMAGCGTIVVLSFWGGVSRRFPGARQLLRRLPKGEALEKALGASRQFGRDPLFLVRVMTISMLLNVICVFQIMALAKGLNLRIPPLALFMIVPVVVCISALPISPSGLGVRENLYVVMLEAPGIGADATAALSLSLLAYAGSLVWSVIGGVVYIARKDRDHLAEIAKAPAPEEG